MRRKLVLTFLLCFAAIPGFAQNQLNGKWATDKPANLNDVPDPFRRSQSVQLELRIEDAKASGALGGLGGRFITFKDAKVSGDKFQFRTTPEKDPNAVTTWAVELVDENTALISHDQVDSAGTYPPGTVLGDITGSRPRPVIPPATATLRRKRIAERHCSGFTQCEYTRRDRHRNKRRYGPEVDRHHG